MSETFASGSAQTIQANFGGWQPIATAPKDDDVLLFREGWGVRAGFWFDLEGEPFWFAAETQGVSGGRMEPTHWRKFPDPPVSPAGERSE